MLRKEIKIIGAGRTDTGVHARQLFAHFENVEIHQPTELIFKLNSFLPQDISVKNIFRVKPDAHARFDAVGREYEYLITVGKDPFMQDFSHQIYNKPNVDLMNDAATILLQHNDFQCFSRSKTDVKTYHCTIDKAHWETIDNSLIFTIAADRFLRNMVRAIVGTLLDVGYGKISLERFKTILMNKNRAEAGASAPAKGLYLTKVIYPNEIFINGIMKNG